MSIDQQAPAVIPAGGIAAAASWWASRLGNCHHDPVGLDAPHRRLTVDDMEWAIEMNLQVKRGKYSAEQAGAYQRAMGQALGEHLEGCRKDGFCMGKSVGSGRHVLNCDYDPDEVLCRAAEIAGIDLDSYDLPCKTFMILKAGAIVVSEGYGAPLVTIWPA